MKKLALIFTVFFVLLFAAGCGAPPVSGADDVKYPVESAYGYLTEFLTIKYKSDAEEDEGNTAGTELKNRTAGSEGEKLAAKYLQEKFERFGLADIAIKDFDIGDGIKSQNVVGTIKGTASDHKVIIGAHYDNVYGDGVRGSSAEGAYDNGTGVAVMLAVAEHLAANPQDRPFDIEFVAFGAEEIGFYGSREYVSKMSSRDIESTLLMVNLDVVGGGDYLYLYCDEVNTEHEELLHRHAQGLGAPLNRPPANKKVYYASSGITPYSHYGMSSDNISFMTAGINTAFFFSMNWSANFKSGVTESADHRGIIHTSLDTLDSLNEFYQEGVKTKMNAAASVTVSALNDSDFVDTMLRSKQDKYDYSWMVNGLLFNIIKAVLLMLLLLLIILLSRHYNIKYQPVIIPNPPPIKRTVFEDYEGKNDNTPPENPFEGY